MEPKPKGSGGLSRREFNKLGLLTLAGLAVGPFVGWACEVSAMPTPEPLTPEEKLKETALRQLIETNIASSLATITQTENSESTFPPESQLLFMGLGEQIVAGSLNGKKIVSELWDKLKFQSIDPTLEKFFNDLNMEMSDGKPRPVFTNATQYYLEGNSNDFVVYVPPETTGKPEGIWYKFVRAPRQSGEYTEFEQTMKLWNYNAKKWNLFSPEQADMMRLFKATIPGNEQVPTRQYYVFGTPNIEGGLLTNHINIGNVTHEEANQLYYQWFRKVLSSLQEGNYSLIHQDPHASNFFVFNRDGTKSLAPFDFEGETLLFKSAEDAAIRQANMILRVSNKTNSPRPNLQSMGIMVDEASLLREIQAVFPNVTSLKQEVIKINFPLNNSPINRQIYLILGQDQLKGIKNPQSTIRALTTQALQQIGMINDTVTVNIPAIDGSVRQFDWAAIPSTFSLPDVPEIPRVTTMRAYANLIGAKIIPMTKLLLKGLEIAGWTALTVEVYDQMTHPNIGILNTDTDTNPTGKIWLQGFNPYMEQTRNLLFKLSENLMKNADLADFSGPNIPSSLVNYGEKTATEVHGILVPKEYQIPGDRTLDHPDYIRYKSYYPLLAAIRTFELTLGVPLSETMAQKYMQNDQFLWGNVWGNVRNTVENYLHSILLQAGIWHETNLTGGIDPLLGGGIEQKINSKLVVDEDLEESVITLKNTAGEESIIIHVDLQTQEPTEVEVRAPFEVRMGSKAYVLPVETDVEILLDHLKNGEGLPLAFLHLVQ